MQINPSPRIKTVLRLNVFVRASPNSLKNVPKSSPSVGFERFLEHLKLLATPLQRHCRVPFRTFSKRTVRPTGARMFYGIFMIYRAESRLARFWAVLPSRLGSDYSMRVKGIPGTIQDGGAAFATTHWSVVAACASDDETASAALAQLCCDYWPPLYTFARRRGYIPADAQDIVQGFFAYLLQSKAYARTHPTKGKFRSFVSARKMWLARICKATDSTVK